MVLATLWTSRRDATVGNMFRAAPHGHHTSESVQLATVRLSEVAHTSKPVVPNTKRTTALAHTLPYPDDEETRIKPLACKKAPALWKQNEWWSSQ